MSTPSNLYAEKVFAEHPVSLWPLDDKADYISLIAEEQRDVSLWEIIGGTAENYTEINDEPFPESHTTLLTGEVPTGLTGSIECISNTNIIDPASLNSDMGTFSIGTYIYSQSPYVDNFEIGYRYYDIALGQNVNITKRFSLSIPNKWIFVSETFDIPINAGSIKIIFKVNYISGGSSEDYKFLINGISFGQWSEEFNSVSLGVFKQTLPVNIFPTTQYGIATDTYGLKESFGYYLVKNNALVARNSGVPMVYGSSNVTLLSPNNGDPSLILPGNGFLNNLGKYKNQTFEMWLRITADTNEQRRIFGPIRSDNGLYVEGPFLKFKIDDNVGSHYVGEWSRPMLIHISIKENNSSVLVNGEEVISLNYITSDLNLPEEYTGSLHNDWVGFYAYNDVSPIEVDSVAIYSYPIAPVIAKRRFVYGQGVEFPENINTSYSGSSVYIDYPFADYTNNYNYPDRGNWRQGSIENLSVVNNVLTTPDYDLPDLVLESITSDIFFDSNLSLQTEDNNLVSFKYNGSQLTNGYLIFPNLKVLNDDVKAIYGVFKGKTLSSAQTLIKIENENTGDYFEIELEQTTIRYKLRNKDLNNNEVISTIYEAYGYDVGEIFSVGINFKNFSDYFSSKVSEFFSNKNLLKVYIGGNKDFTKTFSGNIYKVGFCNEKNYSEIDFLFNSYGVTLDYENVFELFQQTLIIQRDAGNEYFGNGGSYYDQEGNLIPNLGIYWDYVINGGDPFGFVSAQIIDHTASYTLVPKIYFNKLILDIDVKGSWQDYIPLTYFAQYVKDSKGDSYYDLDFLQLNLDYPAPSKYIEEESISDTGWTYAQLQSEYSVPVQRTYESLDNHLYTGYNDYEDLKNKSQKNYSYDTTNSLVKANINFQYLENGANSTQDSFSTTVSVPKGGLVEPGSNWLTTQYEVVDNTIIYPPVGINFEDLAIVINLNFKVSGILNNKVKLRNLQLCSQAFNKDSSNPIGTRFGLPIYPYTKAGLYFNYKERNPFSIYKSSSPYLYMTRYSGVQLRGQYDPLINRGLSIPVNQTKADNYKITAMQLAVRYDEDFFPYAPTQIFEIQNKNSTIKFYMVATQEDGKRGKIYAVNATTGRLENGIAFYLNGNIVKDPILNIKQWAFLGISFTNRLNFSNYRGAFRINGPILVNTISYYQSTNLQEVQQTSSRPWFRVKFAPPLTLNWQYWDAAYMWQGVLVLSTSSFYGVDPSDIYKSYTGTNKIIIDDPTTFSFKNYEYFIIKDVNWQSNTVNAL